jgi:hypothetical protein
LGSRAPLLAVLSALLVEEDGDEEVASAGTTPSVIVGGPAVTGEGVLESVTRTVGRKGDAVVIVDVGPVSVDAMVVDVDGPGLGVDVAGDATRPASVRPGVSGCVSRMLRSAATQRICIAGPTVTASAPRVKPQIPPRKSDVSEVQANPLGTHQTAVSPGATAGNPSAVLVLVNPQPGPTAKPAGQIAGE